MSNPTSDWDKVPISACYRLIGGGYDSGTVSFTLSQRITTVDGSGLYARGQKITVSVSDSDGALSLNFPASDDPDVSPNGWSIKVEENLKSKGGQVYYITPTLAAGSVNLNTVVVPDDAPSAPPPVYARGQAGGLAGLDSDGDVINAAGDKVTGGDASTLSALSDVSTTGVTDGQALVYSTDDSKWVPGTAAGASDLADLTDVDTTTSAPTDGQALIYDTDDSKWKPGTISSGGGASALTDLTDVSADSPTSGQVLAFDGTDWSPSDLTVDAGNVSGLADVATSGAYSDLTGTPTIPTTAAEVGAVPDTRTVNGKELSADVTLAASDVGAATTAQGATADSAVQPGDLAAVATGGTLGDLTDVNITAKADGYLLGWDADTSSNVYLPPSSGSVTSVNGQTGIVTLAAADVAGVVPETRTINDKPLSADVTLGASDVGAVPTTRTVNGKPLSADVTLDADDVGAAAVDGDGRIATSALPTGLTMFAVEVSGIYPADPNPGGMTIWIGPDNAGPDGADVMKTNDLWLAVTS